MKWQSEIAYLPKFPKTMTNLLMIMISMLMIKKILKFKIRIMTLPIIMTHLWKYALLYHVRWYHCNKQVLQRNHSKSHSDVIVDDISIISMVFDRMRYIDYGSSVNLSYGIILEKSSMVAGGGVRRFLKPQMKPKLEYHSRIAIYHTSLFIFHLHTINIDRVTAIQISWPFGETVTLSFDLWYWKVSCLEIVSWYAYPRNLIAILFLHHKTLVFKLAS